MISPEKLQEAVRQAARMCTPKEGSYDFDMHLSAQAVLFLHEQVKELQKEAETWKDRAAINGKIAMAIQKEIEDGVVVYSHDDYPPIFGTVWTNELAPKAIEILGIKLKHKAKLVRVEPLK